MNTLAFAVGFLFGVVATVVWFRVGLRELERRGDIEVRR